MPALCAPRACVAQKGGARKRVDNAETRLVRLVKNLRMLSSIRKPRRDLQTGSGDGLKLGHRRVPTAPLDELFVTALLDHTAFIEDHDVLRDVAKGRQAVRNDDHR